MQAKNKPAPTAAERAHIERRPVVGFEGLYEVEQSLWWASIPLCASCHRDNFNGVHGQARIWKVKKVTELVALNATIRTLMRGSSEH